jgi:hypothetical protein
MLIDSEIDHVERGINIQYVYEMAEKARTREDGTLVEKPHFEGKYDPSSRYNACLCGHYNHVSCVLQGKGGYEKG